MELLIRVPLVLQVRHRRLIHLIPPILLTVIRLICRIKYVFSLRTLIFSFRTFLKEYRQIT